MCRIGLGLILFFEVFAWAAAPDSWAVAKSSSFEVYSQSGAGSARAGLQWLEQLRAFFATQTGLEAEVRPPVRVIGFASRKEYDSYRITPIADAFYVGTESRDYIVLPSLAPAQFRSAAHEYAHVVIHAAGFHPPRWLDDGLAEVMSTVRFTDSGTLVGAEVPAHRQTLRAGRWIALGKVLAQDQQDQANRSASALFYAEAWALTHMLLFSPEYAPHFPERDVRAPGRDFG